MGKSSGCFLIVAGLALAAYALYPEPQAGSDTAAAQSAPAGGGAGTPPTSRVAGIAAEDSAGKQADAVGAPQQAPKPAAAPPSSSGKTEKNEKGGPPSTGVVPAPNLVPPVPVPAKRPRAGVAAVTVDETPPRVPVGETKATAPPLNGAALTREIQRHLKRVGCYQGEATGIWTPAVRQAMRAFTERANASLPVDGPDPVLLAMVQSHAPGACSAVCPQGQDRAANGRCVPSALMAAAKGDSKTAKASTDTAAKKSAGTQPVASVKDDASATTSSPTAHRPKAAAKDERMSLSGPPAADAPQVKARPSRQAKVAGWSRSAQGRPRERRAYRPSPYKGYSGLPSWALPFLMP